MERIWSVKDVVEKVSDDNNNSEMKGTLRLYLDVVERSGFKIVKEDEQNEERQIDSVVVATRNEAEGVMRQLHFLVKRYGVVTVEDYYDLFGLSFERGIDRRWGWTKLENVDIQQVRDGFKLNLPPAVSFYRGE